MTHPEAERGKGDAVAIEDFKRHDTEDRSTLFCPCGATFEWEGFSAALHPWMDKHAEHVRAAAREALEGKGKP